MNEREVVLQLLPIVMHVDKRLQCHTYNEVEPSVFEHVEVKCPLCQALWLLNKYK
jgi:hypothetical protein